MREKLLIFVYDKKKNKFLLLSKKNFLFVKRHWFTLSREIKEFEKAKKIIKSEIKREIGLIVKDVFSLNWGSTYKIKDKEFKEMIFIAFVYSNNRVLKNKNLKYNWMPIHEFVRKIDWKDNKDLLKEVLKKGINKELYFDKKERGQ